MPGVNGTGGPDHTAFLLRDGEKHCQWSTRASAWVSDLEGSRGSELCWDSEPVLGLLCGSRRSAPSLDAMD